MGGVLTPACGGILKGPQGFTGRVICGLTGWGAHYCKKCGGGKYGREGTRGSTKSLEETHRGALNVGKMWHHSGANIEAGTLSV